MAVSPRKLRREDLQPLGIRTRLAMDYASREELFACLEHLLASAGNAALMTAELKHTLCEHAIGNYRALTNMGAEVLSTVAKRHLPKLDESSTSRSSPHRGQAPAPSALNARASHTDPRSRRILHP